MPKLTSLASGRGRSLYKTQIDERFELINHMGFITPLILVFTAVRLSAVYVGGWYLSTVVGVGGAGRRARRAPPVQHEPRVSGAYVTCELRSCVDRQRPVKSIFCSLYEYLGL